MNDEWLNTIRELITEINSREDVAFVEFIHGDFEFRLTREDGGRPAERPERRRSAEASGQVAEGLPARDEASAASSLPDNREAEGGSLVRSPMVGIFYRAPQPGADPFVEVGTVVEEGETLALIEAMKVFTAISARVAGVVTAIYPENGAFVEYEQPICLIKSSE